MDAQKFEFVRFSVGLMGRHEEINPTMISFQIEKCKKTEERRVTAQNANTLEEIQIFNNPTTISKEKWEATEKFCSFDDIEEWQAFANLMEIR